MVLFISDDDANTAVKSTAGVPSGVPWALCFSRDNDFIGFVIDELVGYITFKTKVAIIGLSYMLAIEIDITHQHDASEIKQHTLVLPGSKGYYRPSIDTFGKFFEATCRQTALDIGGRICGIAFLFGRRGYPRL